MKKNKEKKEKQQPVLLYNRTSMEYELERVMGNKTLRIMYDTAAGRLVSKPIVKTTVMSKIYGKYADMKISRPLVKKMIKDLKIDITEYKEEKYKNLNSFFYRKKETIEFPKEKELLVSPCDANMSIWSNIQVDSLIQAKNREYSLEELIADKELAKEYEGGTCIRFRLSPYHYHRAHVFDDADLMWSKRIRGGLHTVNPIAWKKISKVLCENKRVVNMLDTQNFGEVLMLEIGALFVGSIIHLIGNKSDFQRGDEFSYFKFGGSMIMLFFKKDTVVIDEDILKQTELGYETMIKVGEKIGVKKKND